MLIAGTGAPGENCEFVKYYITCPCKSRIIPVRESCQRAECPECYREWAGKAGARVSDLLRGVRAAYQSVEPDLGSDYMEIARNVRRTQRIRHWTFSPPPGLIQEGTSLPDAFRVFQQFRKGRFLVGGVVWFHPYRIKQVYRDLLLEYMKSGQFRENLDEENGGLWRLIHLDVLNLGSWRDYVYWSPHFHILGFGGLPDAKVFYRLTGWVYKMHGHRPLEIKPAPDGHLVDSVKRTASYISTHAGIEPGKDSRRVFGICAPRNIAKVKDPLTGQDEVRLVKKSYLKCPKCGAYLTEHWGIPGDLHDTEKRVESKLVFYRYCIRLKAKDRDRGPPAAAVTC